MKLTNPNTLTYTDKQFILAAKKYQDISIGQIKQIYCINRNLKPKTLNIIHVYKYFLKLGLNQLPADILLGCFKLDDAGTNDYVPYLFIAAKEKLMGHIVSNILCQLMLCDVYEMKDAKLCGDYPVGMENPIMKVKVPILNLGELDKKVQEIMKSSWPNQKK